MSLTNHRTGSVSRGRRPGTEAGHEWEPGEPEPIVEPDPGPEPGPMPEFDPVQEPDPSLEPDPLPQAMASTIGALYLD
jgi:hypothetical protein